MSNCLDPDQARHFVGSDLSPNSLQRLSADKTSRQRIKVLFLEYVQELPDFIVGLTVIINNQFLKLSFCYSNKHRVVNKICSK